MSKHLLVYDVTDDYYQLTGRISFLAKALRAVSYKQVEGLPKKSDFQNTSNSFLVFVITRQSTPSFQFETRHPNCFFFHVDLDPLLDEESSKGELHFFPTDVERNVNLLFSVSGCLYPFSGKRMPLATFDKVLNLFNRKEEFLPQLKILVSSSLTVICEIGAEIYFPSERDLASQEVILFLDTECKDKLYYEKLREFFASTYIPLRDFIKLSTVSDFACSHFSSEDATDFVRTFVEKYPHVFISSSDHRIQNLVIPILKTVGISNKEDAVAWMRNEMQKKKLLCEVENSLNRERF